MPEGGAGTYRVEFSLRITDDNDENVELSDSTLSGKRIGVGYQYRDVEVDENTPIILVLKIPCNSRLTIEINDIKITYLRGE
jgi:hypothetical protein